MKKDERERNQCTSSVPLRGFTLAEVLITLAIIGVVAALTIPPLLQNIQNQQFVSAVLKFDSNIHSVINKWKVDEGCDDNVANCLASQGLSDGVFSNFDQFAKYMQVQAKCVNSACKSVSWLPDNTKNYYGDTVSAGYGQVAKTGYGQGAYLLTDGTTFSMDVDSTGFDITFDVNGMKKPNRMGKDVFKLCIGGGNGESYGNKDIYYDSLHVDVYDNGSGLCSGICNPNNIDPTKDNGAMPLTYVLLNKKIPDFKELSKTVSGMKP